jgi:hypothetical protein
MKSSRRSSYIAMISSLFFLGFNERILFIWLFIGSGRGSVNSLFMFSFSIFNIETIRLASSLTPGMKLTPVMKAPPLCWLVYTLKYLLCQNKKSLAGFSVLYKQLNLEIVEVFSNAWFCFWSSFCY